MGTTYSASVFYGTYVLRRSPTGKRLDRYIDRHGGSPVPTDTAGVEIDVVGDDSSPLLTIQINPVAAGSGVVSSLEWTRSIDAGREELRQPALLPIPPPEWLLLIGRFLESERLSAAVRVSLPPIGFYFVGSCS